MSYEKCNSIGFVPSKRTVSLSLASSNVTPTYYERVVLEADTDEEFIDNIRSVFNSLMDRNVQFSTATRTQVQEAYYLTLKFIKDNNLEDSIYNWGTTDYDIAIKTRAANIAFAKFLSESFRKTRNEHYAALHSNNTAPHYWDPVAKIPYSNFSLITKFGRKSSYGARMFGAPNLMASRDAYFDDRYILGDFGSMAYRFETLEVFDIEKENINSASYLISEKDLEHFMSEIVPRLEPIRDHREEYKAYMKLHGNLQEDDK